MTFSQEWNQRYKENTHISVWPWSDLVSHVMHYSNPLKKNLKVLELGCGAGANIPFFTSFDSVEYYSVEGSSIIVKKLWKKFPKLKENIIIGDFIHKIPLKTKFDLIVDRAAVTCNSTKAIRKCINEIYSKLKVRGIYIGIDWYSTLSSEFKQGESVDEYTKKNYKTGSFANTGLVHFSDKEHIVDLFKKFAILTLEHKIRTVEIPNEQNILATWNFVVQKKLP